MLPSHRSGCSASSLTTSPARRGQDCAPEATARSLDTSLWSRRRTGLALRIAAAAAAPRSGKTGCAYGRSEPSTSASIPSTRTVASIARVPYDEMSRYTSSSTTVAIGRRARGAARRVAVRVRQASRSRPAAAGVGDDRTRRMRTRPRASAARRRRSLATRAGRRRVRSPARDGSAAAGRPARARRATRPAGRSQARATGRWRAAAIPRSPRSSRPASASGSGSVTDPAAQAPNGSPSASAPSW